MHQAGKIKFYNYGNHIRFLDCMYGYLLSICHYKTSYLDIQKTLIEVMPYPISIYATQHTSLVKNGVYRKQLMLREIIGVFKSCAHHLEDQPTMRFGITNSKLFVFDCESYSLILKPTSNTSSMLIAKKK